MEAFAAEGANAEAVQIYPEGKTVAGKRRAAINRR